MKTNLPNLKISVALLMAVVVTSIAQATNIINIPNYSFELQTVTAGSFAITNPADWSVSGQSGGAVVAIINPATGDGRFNSYPPLGLDASNYCQIFMNQASGSATVYQDLGPTNLYQGGVTYTLSAYFGWEQDSAPPTGALVFYNSSLVAIASNTITEAMLTSNAFTYFSVTYTATGSEGGNGDIVVGFNVTSATPATSFDFDNVSLVSSSFYQTVGQGARFFRISGPTAATITAFNPDGTLVWSNAMANTNYTLQTATSLVGGGNWVDFVQLPITQAVNTNLIYPLKPPAGMVFIQAGSFTMGDTLDGEADATPTNVYVSAFYMDQYDVTLPLWQQVFNWATNNGWGVSYLNAEPGPAANDPMGVGDWNVCVSWCNARSLQAGLTPVYYTDTGLTQVCTNTANPVYANWSANGYRLPTEAEWEKAARGGLSGQRFPWGNTISWSQANYFGCPGCWFYDYATGNENDPAFNGMSPVGSFAANGYGLYDMAGNAWQWCWDWYGVPYGQPTTTNPTGPTSGFNLQHLVRGGNWSNPAPCDRCALRGCYGPPYTASGNSGFRCVRGH